MAALKLNLPKTTGIGAGSKTGAAIGGVKIPKTVNPKAFFSAPKAKAPPPQQQTHSPYDQFMLSTPYDPATINQTAQSGYDTDTANAAKLAGMGYLTTDQLNAQAANRATNAQGVAASLRDQLAGIQQASVAQSNAGGALLAQQNAAAAAGGPNIAGAPPSPGVIGTGGAQAVIASQGAAGGNYYGTLQAAAASSGAQNAQKAYDAGNTAITTQNAEKQKTLASLLAGVAPVSKRESDMTDANYKTSAANIQTKLSVYQQLVNQSQFAATTGNKLAMSKADNQLKQYEAQLSSADKRLMNIQDNQTRLDTTRSNNQTRAAISDKDRRAKAWQAKQDREAKVKAAKLTADGKLATASGTTVIARTPSQRRQDLNGAIKILNTAGGTTTTAPTSYTVTIQDPIPKINGVEIPGTPQPKPRKLPISAADYKSGAWKSKVPSGAKVQGSVTPVGSKSTIVNKPGGYTKYNRAAAYLKGLGWSQVEIKSALKQYHP